MNDVAEPPLAPGQPTLAAQGETILSATVTPPDNTGRPAITGYQAQYRVNDSGDPFTLSDAESATSTLVISNLQANTEYEVQVRAVNADGDGAWSASGTGSTREGTPTVTPVAFGSIPAASVTVGATTPGVDVSAYFTGAVDTYTASSSDDTKATVAVSNTSTVTGVAAGTATITVTATNTGGITTQAFDVTVADAVEPPVATGTIPDASVGIGFAPHEVNVSGYFTGTVDTYTAASSDDTKATAEVVGSVVRVRVNNKITVMAGDTVTVTVTAANNGGMATQTFMVTARLYQICSDDPDEPECPTASPDHLPDDVIAMFKDAPDVIPAGGADASEDFPAGQQIRRPQLHHPRRCGGRDDAGVRADRNRPGR